MRNFETRYVVMGTAALKVDASESRVQGTIIEFPLPHEKKPCHVAPSNARSASSKVLRSAQALRQGSVLGTSFNRIAPWQAASAGIALCATALVAIFFGI